MDAERANVADTDELVELRVAYLTEDIGVLDGADEAAIRRGLPDYFAAHLGRDLHVYVVREGGRIASCAFLVVIEKPMSPAFMSGRTGIVLNVYTQPDCRRRGYAKQVMEALLDDAVELGLSVVDLQATDDGYPLYRLVGFEDDKTGYPHMKWFNRCRT